jgi:hypothetical protein
MNIVGTTPADGPIIFCKNRVYSSFRVDLYNTFFLVKYAKKIFFHRNRCHQVWENSIDLKSGPKESFKRQLQFKKKILA